MRNPLTMYDVTRQHGNAGFKVEVIEKKYFDDGIYCSNGGLDNYRFMMFHTPMSVTTGDGKVHQVQPGGFTIFDSQEPSMYGRADTEWSHSWIRVTGPSVSSLLLESGLRKGIIYNIDEDNFFYWLNTIIHELNGLQASGKVLECLFMAMLHSIRSSLDDKPEIEPGILQACSWLEQHCTEELVLDNLAEMAGYSKSHFCALFKKRIGMSAGEYAKRHRLKIAEMLLEDRNVSIKEVAARCGFYDLYHFSKTFSKAYNISPSKYRNR